MWKSWLDSRNVVLCLRNYLVICSAFLWGPSAWAAVIVSYDTVSLGGNQWRYEYTVEGTAPATGFDGLTIYFEPTDYTLLDNLSAPAAWDGLTVQPDVSLGGRGFIDLLHIAGPLNGAIAPFSFSVEFTFLTAGAPASQQFDLYSLSPFATVQSGQTQSLAVAEPATVLLAGIALLLAMRTTGGRRPSFGSLS